ncbi:hypothetical protein D6851_00935 [Altericroceibacterium spongiae]|uniref:FecR protein domain-containing protein n=1 Tax=Altericroceibacterium spongiae TaxID=2320269 RepID=A0A420EQX5_9SPHN|nr:FecR domain-containing protein [Altericroceibacterium spongiae]RKF23096.1 hypothetical protein D6851_00935 [Altericroceibacterium spongiae]
MSQQSESLREAEREEGARLFLRARETGSDRDCRELEQWVAEDPERRMLLRDLDYIWDGVGSLENEPQVMQWRDDIESVSGSGRGRTYLALAASLLLAVAFGSVSLLMSHREAETAQLMATSIGERTEATLEDGSTILLDSASEVAVEYSRDVRQVRLLRGQAWFRVAHNPDRPFQVVADGEEIRALGTEFNVAVERAGPTVSLIKGRVLVSHLENREAFFGLRDRTVKLPVATLEAGQQLSYNSESQPRIRTFDPAAVSAWKKGRIIFEDLPLDKAIAIVNRYSRRSVELDPQLPPIRMTGVFNAGDGLAFARTAATYLPNARLTINEKSIVIQKD